MMIIMQFTFQIILLAVGFGIGYFLLIIANNQQGTMKTIGQTLGGILIVMAMILAIFSCYYSMKISSKGYMQGSCPIQKMLNQQEAPIVDGNQSGVNEDGSSDETRPNTNQNVNDSSSDAPEIDSERPIKSDIKDHE